MFVHMSEGQMEGFFAMGQNPAVGGQNASFQRQALAKLKWLVVRDLYETETASFWKDAPEVRNGTLRTEDIESADPVGRPWAKEARLAATYSAPLRDGQRIHFGSRVYSAGDRHPGYVYWTEVEQGAKRVKQWVGLDVPDFPLNKAPEAPADPSGVGIACHDGASPFLMKPDGKGWLFVPSGLLDEPLPAHYEPYESPLANAVYRQQANPAVLVYDVPGNAYAPVGSPEFPHVLSTYRLTEHRLNGVMSRWLPWLSELMPELFCEISPEHAAAIGVGNTDWVRIRTPRGSIRAKALVTRRIRSFRLGGGRLVHHVGLPWHWGYKGVTTGDVANDLSALVADPDVTIHEAKVLVCDVEREQGPGMEITSAP